MANVSWVRLLESVLICLAAGFVGSLYTTPSISTWYASLSKPWFTPPNWLFGPVWTTLYLMMGVSLYLVWQTDVTLSKTRTSIAFFAAQLILNTAWSLVFFTLKEIGWAFTIIATMWIMIAATTWSFKKHSRTAAILLVPYLLWVSFAAALNYGILVLN